MSVSLETYLPTEAELTVQEVNMTTAHLRAGAHHVGKFCDEQGKEFMLCRKEEKDPRRCLDEGKAVTACAVKFFQKIKALCREEFEQYAHCIDYSSSEFDLKPCRKTQTIWDKCVFDNMGQERPQLGFFSKARVHQTTRPKPVVPEPVYTDLPGELPKDYPKPPAKYGSRESFIN